MNETFPFNIQLSGMLLTDEKLTSETKLSVIQNLKNQFSNSSKNFSNVSLASLLNETITIQTCGNQDTDFLFSYGNSLINYYGEDSNLDSKILLQVEFVLLELNEKNIECFDVLIKKLWERLEKIQKQSPEVVSRVLKFSKNFLEELVVDWIEFEYTINEENYYTQISSLSPELYRAITEIIYQLLVFSKGNSRVLEVLENFVSSVLLVCEKTQRNFLKLYPEDYNLIVSLIMIPPELLPDESKDERLVTKMVIGNLLLEKFLNESKQILMILCHFPKWLGILQEQLKKNYSQLL